MNNRSIGKYPSMNPIQKTLISALIAGIYFPALAENIDPVVEVVEITGRARSDEAIALESPKPVDVVSAKEIQATGARNVQELLLRVLPSANFPQSEQSFNSIGKAQGISLRGLSPGQTLILVNGKRQHNSSFVHTGTNLGRGDQVTDITTIPVNAIDHIEVLRDGAATQYGADGLAGVVNLVLKQSSHGGSVSGNIGQYAKGDGLSRNAAVQKGFELPNDGSLTFSVNSVHSEKTDPTRPDPRQWYFAGDPREATNSHRWPGQQGAPHIREIASALNGELPLTPALKLYAFGNYYHANKQTAYGFVRPNEDINDRERYPDGHHPEALVKQDDFQVTTGLRYDGGGAGQFDLSISHGRHAYDHFQLESPNTTFDWDTPSTNFNGAKSYAEQTLDLHWQKQVGDTTTVRAGFAQLHARSRVEAGDPLTWTYGNAVIADGPNAGALVPRTGYAIPYGIRPEDAGRLSRDKSAVYVSAEHRFGRLTADVGARAERYSDLDKTLFTGNAAARFDAGGGLALRGNVNRGARAPGLAQVLHSATSKTVDSVTGAEYRSMFLRADSDVARAMGATALKAEESTGYSLGFVYAPRSDWSFTVDVYRTDIDGRITQSETLTGTAVRQALAAAGQTDITAVSFFQNAVDTRDTGVDITARHNLRYERFGKGSVNVGYNRNRTKITGRLVNPVLPSLSLVGYNVSSLIEDSAPEDKLVASYSHDVGAWDATLSAIRYGKFKYAANALVATDTQSNTYRQTFGAQTVANLVVGYRPTPALRIAAGVRNLFNTHPDEAGYLINFGVTKYSPSSPDGGEGRYVYLSASYDF